MHVKSHDVEAHAGDELAEHCGIIAGTVCQFAEALNTAPGQVVSALTHVGYLNDSGERKGYAQQDRSTDPTRRSLAFTTKQFARLHATIITDE